MSRMSPLKLSSPGVPMVDAFPVVKATANRLVERDEMRDFNARSWRREEYAKRYGRPVPP
jgi:hypothetical protein